MGLSPNMTVRYKMRPNKMALWNEFLPSIEESVKPTTWSERSKADDKKGIVIKYKYGTCLIYLALLCMCFFFFFFSFSFSFSFSFIYLFFFCWVLICLFDWFCSNYIGHFVCFCAYAGLFYQPPQVKN